MLQGLVSVETKEQDMRKSITSAIAAVTALGSVVTATPAQAQNRDRDRDGIPDRQEWNRDRDRDGRLDQYDRNDNRRATMRYWGGRYGYNGYEGRWRTGMRYPYYNNRGYYISDYGRYGLTRPWQGYRYYRTDSGEIVMAAIATGLIGLIASGAFNDGYRYRRY